MDKKDLDRFWDISSLVPKKTPIKSNNNIDTNTVEIAFSHSVKALQTEQKNPTVIKRYIDPLHEENKKIKSETFESISEYFPESSLLHKVVLKKKKCSYDLYSSFFEDAKKFDRADAKESDYVSFYSYVPQYDQLSAEQLAYYLWWRNSFREGNFIKTDLSYVLLYIYELINLGKEKDVLDTQRILSELWNVYHEEFPYIANKLALWICDFSLLYKLPPPENISKSVIKNVPALKEFFIHIPNGDIRVCAASLLKYGTEYNYRTSKFATEKNIDVFDRHVFGAMVTAVKYFSDGEKILGKLSSEDSKLIRVAFEGALTTSDNKYEIEVKYCSFSRSNELRFIMGDVVKYSENKIRAFLGVKSRLSVYSLELPLQQALDLYFEDAFSKEKPKATKKEEKNDYDVLYDTPVRPLSLENAKNIEEASWSTTQELISAFEDETPPKERSVKKEIEKIVPAIQEEQIEDNDIKKALAEYLEFAIAVKTNDKIKISEISKRFGKMPEAIVDEINEIAVDVIGDIFIEDDGTGLAIVDCYSDMI